MLPCLSMCLVSVGRVSRRGRGRFAKQTGKLVLRGTEEITLCKGAELIVHIPIVPAFGSSIRRVRTVTEFTTSLPNMGGVRLLPCRELKRSGCRKLNEPCLVRKVLPPATRRVRVLGGTIRTMYDLSYRVNN